MWHEQLFNILNAINNVVLTLIGIPFMIQIIFMLFGWLRKKKFPKSEKKNRICILFAAGESCLTRSSMYQTVFL